MAKNNETKPTITVYWEISMLWFVVPLILKINQVSFFRDASSAFWIIHTVIYWIFLWCISRSIGVDLINYIKKHYDEEEILKRFQWTLGLYFVLYEKFKYSSDLELRNKVIKAKKIHVFPFIMSVFMFVYGIVLLST